MNELILGLLMIQEQSSYSIKKTIQNGLGLLSSDSIGSIQIALKKLEEKKLIQYEEVLADKKGKKIYKILPLGVEYFNSWVNEPFDLKGKRNTELKKIYFMSYSDKQSRMTRVNQYIDMLTIEKRQLDILKEHGESIYKKLPLEKKVIADFQLETINYGIDFLNFEIQWYTNLVEKRLKNGQKK